MAGLQTALGLSIIATVNMAPMSPKTYWISQTTPHRKLSDNLFPKVYQNPRLTLRILALQPLVLDLAPRVEHINRMRLLPSLEKEVSQVYLVWRS